MDPKKARANVRKRGVSFEEAASVFGDPLAYLAADGLHHERHVLIGLSDQDRLLLTVYVEIAEDSIRIISARRATSHETRQYEEG